MTEEAFEELNDKLNKEEEELRADLAKSRATCDHWEDYVRQLEEHYICAMLNWTIAMDERDDLEKELLKLKTPHKRADAPWIFEKGERVVARASSGSWRLDDIGTITTVGTGVRAGSYGVTFADGHGWYWPNELTRTV